MKRRVFADNETVKAALREAIEARKRDAERFVIELQRIENEERAQREAFERQMQNHIGGGA